MDNWVSDNYTTGMAKNVSAATNPSAAQTAPYEKIPADSFSTLPMGSGAGEGSVGVKTVTGPGPANAGPMGPAAAVVD